MSAATGLFLLFVLFALAIPVAIWALVERETGDRPGVDRQSAERAVRHDDGEGPEDGWDR